MTHEEGIKLHGVDPAALICLELHRLGIIEKNSWHVADHEDADGEMMYFVWFQRRKS